LCRFVGTLLVADVRKKLVLFLSAFKKTNSAKEVLRCVIKKTLLPFCDRLGCIINCTKLDLSRYKPTEQ